jgi:hypothetical protein
VSIPSRERIAAALRKRADNGGKHLHHRNCIHNLPPERQLQMLGRTADWWIQTIGPLPEQISSDQWETEPPEIREPS